MTLRKDDPDHPDKRSRPADEAPDGSVEPIDVAAPLTRAEQLRRSVNLLNLTTPLGLLVAGIGGASTSPGPRGSVLATEYRYAFPKASAFTIGNVILTKKPLQRLLSRQRLLCHETRHCTQYAYLGPLFLPAYGVAALWSLARTGDPASRNVFERRAGLDDGGYVERPIRRRGRRRSKSAVGAT